MVKSLRDGLVGEWLLNGGEAKDTSGEGNHGTLYNSTTGSDNLNRDNNAIIFNGTSTYMDFPTTTTIKQTGDFTYSFWFKRNNVTNAFSYFGISSDANASNYSGTYSDTYDGATSTGMRCIRMISSSSFVALYGPAPMVQYKWYHTVYTFDSVNGTKLYFDGVLYDSDSATTATYFNGTDFNYLGCNADNDTPTTQFGFFDGNISNFKVWNRALDAIEAFQVYSDIKGNYQGLFEGLITYWDMHKDAKDVAGYMDGNIVGSPTLTTDRFGVADSAYTMTTSDYINMSDDTSMLQRNDDYTLFQWVKSPTVNKITLGFENSIGWGLTSGYTGFAGLTDKFSIIHHNGSSWYTAASTTLSNADSDWHLIIGVNNNGSNIKIYVDGVLENTTSYTGGSNIFRGMSVNIGNGVTGAGTFGECGAFQRAYSDGEVKAFYDLMSKKKLYEYLRGGGQ